MALVWQDFVDAKNNGTTLNVADIKAYVTAQAVADANEKRRGYNRLQIRMYV